MEQIEGGRRRAGPVRPGKSRLRAGAVHFVQRANTSQRRLDDRVVRLRRLRRGVGEVAENGEPNLGIPIREILRLDVFERLVHRAHTSEQQWDHDDGPILLRHAVLIVETREARRRHDQHRQLIDDRDRGVRRREERERDERDDPPKRGVIERLRQK